MMNESVVFILGLFELEDGKLKEASYEGYERKLISFSKDNENKDLLCNTEEISWERNSDGPTQKVDFVCFLNKKNEILMQHVLNVQNSIELVKGTQLIFTVGKLKAEYRLLEFLKDKLDLENLSESKKSVTFVSKIALILHVGVLASRKILYITILLCLAALAATGTAVVVNIAKKFISGE